jgi:O-antigen/teichoic acid export membrane protein
MKSNFSHYLKNFSYALVSNLISLVFSATLVLIIPKLVGVEQYGYFQVYMFYSSYVGFLHFGFNDGIHLRYGGMDYNSLDKKKFFSQFMILVITQAIIASIIFTLATFLVDDSSRRFIFQGIAFSLLLVNVRFMFYFILQSTLRFGAYARCLLVDRVVWLFFILIFLFNGMRDFKLMIYADILSSIVSTFVAFISCKEIVFQPLRNFTLDLRESLENYRVGIKIMFANIASLLLIGIVRLGIERYWDVATFGKVSLTLSISNLMMIFITALGAVLFPILRRSDATKLPKLYQNLRTPLMTLLLVLLLLYAPFRILLSAWLPQYAESLVYMAILFPMTVFEGKMSLLVNTYMRTLRQESQLLKINWISVILGIVLVFISVILLHRLDFTVFTIVILLGFRSTLGELVLAKSLSLDLKRQILVELGLILIFIASSWYLQPLQALLVYASFLLVYIFLNLSKYRSFVSYVKSDILHKGS